MPKKTNKTAHILDLITNGAPSESEGSREGETPPAENTGEYKARPSSSKKVKVVDESSRNDQLSGEILSSLTKELKKELTSDSGEQDTEEISGENVKAADVREGFTNAQEQQAGGEITVAAVDAPATREIPMAADNLPAASQAPVLTVDPEADGQIAPPTQEAAPPQQDGLPASAQDQGAVPWSPSHCHISECYFNRNLSEKEYTFVNVMEHLLLRLDLDSFVKEYGVCGCKRCRADVCALALSNLPSKYIVVSSDSLSPLLGYYQNHYKLRLMTELIKACIAVRETPRHSLKDLEVG